MVSKEKLSGALGRLSLLRRFPANPQALTALAEILKETCPNDADLTELVHEVLKTSDDWCGPAAIRKTYDEIINRRQKAEAERLRRQRIKAACIERDKHEATCPGYAICLDESDRSVEVSFCGKDFNNPHDYRDNVCCRVGANLEGTDPKACERILANELAARPGWVRSIWQFDARVPHNQTETARR